MLLFNAMGEEPLPFQFGEFTVDSADRRLHGPAGPIHLGGRAFDVLETLLEAEGRLVTKDELFSGVWQGIAVSDAALTSVIRQLRIALGDAGRNGLIQGVYGQGYRLDPQQLSRIRKLKQAPQNMSAEQPEPRLAVLPFDDLSPNADMEYFSRGISEEILAVLSRGSAIRTLGKLSSFRFRGPKKSDAPRELDATHILDGSVRATRNSVRITVHLFESASEDTLWSETFESRKEKLLALQVSIAATLAAKLDEGFSHEETSEISPELYDLFLRALELDNVPAAYTLQLALLEKVTRDEPTFARAWGYMSVVLANRRQEEPISKWPRTTADANHAIARTRALDPKHPGPLIAEFRLLNPYGEFERQKELLEEAVGSASEDQAFYFLKASHASSIGRMNEAADILAVRRSMDPEHPQRHSFHGVCLYYAGRYEEAKEVMEGDLKAAPGNPSLAVTLALCCACLGDRDGVNRVLSPERLAHYPLGDYELCAHLARAKIDGNDAEKKYLLDKLERTVRRTGHFNLFSAIGIAEAHTPQHCHDIIANASIGSGRDELTSSDQILVNPMLLFIRDSSAIRQDRRFATLCARLGLAQFWTRHDIWPDCVENEEFDYDFCEAMRDAAETTPIDPPLIAV